MELAAAKMIGAGLACSALIGAGVGIGNIFGNYLSGAYAQSVGGPWSVHQPADRLRSCRSNGPLRSSDRAYHSLRLRLGRED